MQVDQMIGTSIGWSWDAHLSSPLDLGVPHIFQACFHIEFIVIVGLGKIVILWPSDPPPHDFQREEKKTPPGSR